MIICRYIEGGRRKIQVHTPFYGYIHLYFEQGAVYLTNSR